MFFSSFYGTPGSKSVNAATSGKGRLTRKHGAWSFRTNYKEARYLSAISLDDRYKCIAANFVLLESLDNSGPPLWRLQNVTKKKIRGRPNLLCIVNKYITFPYLRRISRGSAWTCVRNGKEGDDRIFSLAETLPFSWERSLHPTPSRSPVLAQACKRNFLIKGGAPRGEKYELAHYDPLSLSLSLLYVVDDDEL